MNFEVVMDEKFLSSIITRISARYAVQLAMSGTELVIPKYDDCILSCDDEWAVKYMLIYMTRALLLLWS